jgi:hypothetical protein
MEQKGSMGDLKIDYKLSRLPPKSEKPVDMEHLELRMSCRRLGRA